MNIATRANATTLGVIFGLSGMSHGFFEALQGNLPIDGSFISAIGEAVRMWPHGSEPAFTLIPNFLLTGITAMVVGLAITIWSLGYIQKKNGPTILMLLFVLLFLVGGGLAQLLFFPWIWLVLTRIHKPLTWWRKNMPVKVQELLGKLWPWSLTVCATLLVSVLVIGVTGYVPGVKDPDVVLSIMLTCLGLQLVVLPLTFLSGFAYDIIAMKLITSDGK